MKSDNNTVQTTTNKVKIESININLYFSMKIKENRQSTKQISVRISTLFTIEISQFIAV